MGGSTKLKKEALVKANSEFLEKFAKKSRELEDKKNAPVPCVSEDFEDFEGFFIRPKESFVLKTKSKDRNKQRFEFVKHVFHQYPVPAFMLECWEEKSTFDYRGYQQSYWKFVTKEDYRLWYICMATGGSFYKEYGQTLFTKKEAHIFLNCRHDLTIDQAITYSIAYAECGHLGKSLAIAKSKINQRTSQTYWREVIRFFARQDFVGKEGIDDIVDYIVGKKNEDHSFTIIGKGHTLKSLREKVETWHADLRRLKLIGEHHWQGIEIPNKEYARKGQNNVIDYWKFTQIKSAKELQMEGNRMRHCVLSYKRFCIEGKTSIWSCTLNEERKLTIEVRNADKAVIQVRGLANRAPRGDEKNVVQKWARDSGLYY